MFRCPRFLGIVLGAALMLLSAVPTAATAATLGSVTSMAPLVPGGIGLTSAQEIVWSCPSWAASPGLSTDQIYADGAFLAPSVIGCGTSGQAWITLPDTTPNSSNVTITVQTVNGTVIATGQVATTPSAMSIQPTPIQGATGDAIRVDGSGLSNEDGHAGVTIHGVPATAQLWRGVYSHQWIDLLVPQCVPVGPTQLVVTDANGASTSTMFTVTASTCEGKVTTLDGSTTPTDPTTPTKPTTPTSTSTTPPTTGSTSTPPSGSTPTTTSTSTSLAIVGPASVAAGGQVAYAVAPITQSAITWASSDLSVASVAQSGLLTAHGAGTVTLSAVSAGRSATKTITVAAAAPAQPAKQPAKPAQPKPATAGAYPFGWLLPLLLVLLALLAAAAVLVSQRRRRKAQTPSEEPKDVAK